MRLPQPARAVRASRLSTALSMSVPALAARTRAKPSQTHAARELRDLTNAQIERRSPPAAVRHLAMISGASRAETCDEDIPIALRGHHPGTEINPSIRSAGNQ